MPYKPQRSISERLKDKYRLIIYNDNSFEEVGYIRLKGFNLLWLIGSITVALVAITFVLVAYTNLRELIPGYPDTDMRRRMVLNALKLDSLQNEINMRDSYLDKINDIISGRNPDDGNNNLEKDSINIKNISFKKSEDDSLFRKQIEDEEKYNLMNSMKEQKQLISKPLYNLHFFPPVKGIVTNPFNDEIGHFGTDIVSTSNEVIKTVLDGTVINATWTLETGYIIEIQHENNIISVYKHNSELLKRVGNRVMAGEVIAIIGNSGELSSGPHLHFELWHNGRPLNPEDYIVF